MDSLLSEQDQTALYGVQQQRGLAGTRKDIGITCYLLECELISPYCSLDDYSDAPACIASMKACCTKLPGLHLLRDRLPYFKANLHSLEPPHQLAVVCLCSIGVRVIPNSVSTFRTIPCSLNFPLMHSVPCACHRRFSELQT